jgi:hypothetical protein
MSNCLPSHTLFFGCFLKEIDQEIQNSLCFRKVSLSWLDSDSFFRKAKNIFMHITNPPSPRALKPLFITKEPGYEAAHIYGSYKAS